ncbi:hypothetical protein PoB_004301300 [Plakobranchus ocellatus]|uniref:Uncharacterized protein n=1 Tax=Plakobranchus ocellatus TaxID=259542 RepID=A0AAV4BA84_9GAST|nr:hypothetical protein PoB_004301300 [Plakobranchus ocellatus]
MTDWRMTGRVQQMVNARHGKEDDCVDFRKSYSFGADEPPGATVRGEIRPVLVVYVTCSKGHSSEFGGWCGGSVDEVLKEANVTAVGNPGLRPVEKSGENYGPVDLNLCLDL